MLETIKHALTQTHVLKNEAIIALAPTHKASQELKEKGVHAQTLKSFIIDESQLDGNHYKHLENKLIILDESSMVSNKDFQLLQTIVEKANSCHCAYIGDKAQLLSVEAGIPCEIAYLSKEADIDIATMDEILRQKTPQLKSIVSDLLQSSADHTAQAFKKLEQYGLVKEGNAEQLANYYSNLSLSEQSQTVIAVATNKNRSAINREIRKIRQNRGELSGQSITSPILIDSKLTDAELRYSHNYHIDSIVKINNMYTTLKSIDHKNNSLILERQHMGDQVLNLSLVPENMTLALFHKETIELQVGEKLKWTKTDRDRNLLAHSQFTVTEINHQNNTISAKTALGETLTIAVDNPQNQHIDYIYASTVHGLQGATAKSAIVLLDSHNELSNSMRSLYVAITRATHTVTIFTDNLPKVREQIIGNKGDAPSALMAMGLLETKETEHKRTTIINNDTKAKTYDEQKKPLIDSKQVELSLRHMAPQIFEDILGRPNQSLSNATNWRYGKKGSLSVVIAGPNQGLFHNFETGEKGGMLQLLMSELGLDFKSALAHGQQLLGGHVGMLTHKTNSPAQNKPTIAGIAADDSKKLAYINRLIQQSVPLCGTVAEKYLAKRALASYSIADLRFVEKINTGRGNQDIKRHACALLAIARDQNGIAKAVQLTYLNPKTHEKISDFPIKKRTIGSLKTSVVNLTPSVKEPEVTFVAEGIETALSIKDAISVAKQMQHQVLATLGKSNLGKVGELNCAKNIVLVLDNDKQDWRDDKAIRSAITELEQAGKRIVCMQPTLLSGQKTDYNDLAKLGRQDEIKRDLHRALVQIKADQNIKTAQLPYIENAKTELTKTKAHKANREMAD